ncbi:MAG: hypothetical protein CL472_01305 [Acidobacteria bacterium]|nr:hypothetical protein [Acidobacteriota bacterium]
MEVGEYSTAWMVHKLGVFMKTASYLALVAMIASPVPAMAQAGVPAQAATTVGGECGIVQDAPIFGVGMGGSTQAAPVLIPIEQEVARKGDKSNSLRSVSVPAVDINEWPTDYAMMRLSQLASKPVWAVTQSGSAGNKISVQIPQTNLADAFDRIAAVEGKRWIYDGERAYLLNGREWTMPLPASRDVAFAVKDALSKNAIDARIESGLIRFEADDAGAAKVAGIVSQVYAQPRLNPYDVSFYKIWPVRGSVDWAKLAERTDAVEAVSFDGKGSTVVLDPGSESVIDAFLATEGTVRSLGSTVMVSAQPGLGTLHGAGCGASADSSIGLELAGGAYERGRIPLRYAITGGENNQGGAMAVVPGSTVVIADGEPHDGAYMVAVVRPRILEMQSTPIPVAAGAPAPK